MTADYDPLSLAWRDDPYPCYRALRDTAPVQWSPSTNAWCVSRYDDVMFVLRNPELFSSRAMFTFLMNNGNEGRPPLNWKVIRFLARFVWQVRLNPFEFTTARNLIAEDGESHTAMRNIVNRGFTPRRISAWEARAQELVDQAMAKLRSGGSFDLVEDLAIPLPVTVIAEMLGVEAERHADFKRWSDCIISGITGTAEGMRPETLLQAFSELSEYVTREIEQRRTQPREDLITTLTRAGDGETTLSPVEVMGFTLLLLVAGNETTTNLLGNAMLALLEHPDQLARVQQDPGLVPSLVEEALRYDSPAQFVYRRATGDLELAGTSIPEGSTVMALIGSANRDEEQFPDGDRFDVARNPQGHLGFGVGIHFCLGASLARLEARVTLEELLTRFHAFERMEPGVQYIDSYLVRGPRRLPLRFEVV